MRRFVVIPVLLGLAAPAPVWAQGLWAACQVRTVCAGVQSGGGRIFDCLREHKAELSEACYVAVGRFMVNRPRRGGHATVAAPATATAPAAANQGPDPAAANMAPVPGAAQAAPAPQ